MVLLASCGLEAYIFNCFGVNFVEMAVSPIDVNGLFNGTTDK